jgi:CarboxypepD_reg-like domain
MSEQDNNIKMYSAADIEKYHSGKMNSFEMHAMEKAALDDPFLADALEGYRHSKTIPADIDWLKKTIDHRVQSAKVVSMSPTLPKGSKAWLKIAAAVIGLLGTGLLVYQFGFNQKAKPDITAIDTKESAKPSELQKKDESVLIDSLANTTAGADKDNKQAGNNGTIAEPNKDQKSETTVELNTTAVGKESEKGITAVITPPPSSNVSQAPATAPVIERKEIATSADKQIAAKDNIDRDNTKGILNNKSEDANRYKNQNAETSNAAVQQNRGFTNTNNTRRANVFSGRVTDANNNALPFANVTNVDDKVGTYADAKGYFTLTSPDSALNVQVRSVGFEQNQYRLQQNNQASNQLVLKEDKAGLQEVVVTGYGAKKKVASRARSLAKEKAPAEEEEPEPEDGWDNYDTYVANNLNEPGVPAAQKPGAGVEVSFDVNRNGKPVNLKVEKSLCTECDKEALRLIKEGPKWKRKNKSSRAKVTVNFAPTPAPIP